MMRKKPVIYDDNPDFESGMIDCKSIIITVNNQIVIIY